jgi:hypothetical protein
VNWLRFIIVAITAIALGIAFRYRPTDLDGFGLFFALLGVVFLASTVLKKSK